MPQRKIIDDHKLIELYRQGRTLKEIGDALGVSAVAVCKRAKRLNLKAQMILDRYDIPERQKRFVLAKASGMSNAKAVMASGYDVSNVASAKTLGAKLMKREEVAEAYSDILMEAGVTPVFTARRHKFLLDHDDPSAVARGLDMYHKIQGTYAPDKISQQHEVFVQVDLSRFDRLPPGEVIDVTTGEED